MPSSSNDQQQLGKLREVGHTSSPQDNSIALMRESLLDDNLGEKSLNWLMNENRLSGPSNKPGGYLQKLYEGERLSKCDTTREPDKTRRST